VLVAVALVVLAVAALVGWWVAIAPDCRSVLGNPSARCIASDCRGVTVVLDARCILGPS
jgi:hypothetical protein